MQVKDAVRSREKMRAEKDPSRIAAAAAATAASSGNVGSVRCKVFAAGHDVLSAAREATVSDALTQYI